MRLIDADAFKKTFFEDCAGECAICIHNINHFEYCDLIDNAPTVEIPTELCKDCRFLKDCETCEEKLRPQDEMIETKYRLNLLIGVLYSNQLISENDLEYIEDSVKELMKGGAKMKGAEE